MVEETENSEKSIFIKLELGISEIVFADEGELGEWADEERRAHNRLSSRTRV